MDRTMISGSRDECLHAAWDYWRRLDESECFDIEGIEAPPGAIALIPYDCQLPNSFHPLPLWVKLYASAGLHRFNMLEGTNFKLGYVMKFNKRLALLSPYYITLLAQDSVSGSHQSFQVLVNERSVGKLNIIIPIARPKGVTTNERLIPCDSFSVDDKLPQWPSHDSFNDTKRFYLVKESELQNNDWINLYLELVLCAIQRVRISDSDLSKLKIVKAVIETKEDMVSPNERLNAKTAVVYITFKGLANARIAAGEHDERKAIIRRIFNEHTGHLSLLGDLIGEKKFVNIDPVTYFNSPAYLEDITHELPPDSPWMDILAGTGLLQIPNGDESNENVARLVLVLNNSWVLEVAGKIRLARLVLVLESNSLPSFPLPRLLVVFTGQIFLSVETFYRAFGMVPKCEAALSCPSVIEHVRDMFLEFG